jgi:hypothetical protein
MELARLVHEHRPHVLLMITSGNRRPSTAEIADHGHFLPKPWHRLDYEFCVPTGDCRGRTHGDCGPCLEGVSRVREALRGDLYAVLGNHDSITMVPDPRRSAFACC